MPRSRKLDRRHRRGINVTGTLTVTAALFQATPLPALSLRGRAMRRGRHQRRRGRRHGHSDKQHHLRQLSLIPSAPPRPRRITAWAVLTIKAIATSGTVPRRRAIDIEGGTFTMDNSAHEQHRHKRRRWRRGGIGIDTVYRPRSSASTIADSGGARRRHFGSLGNLTLSGNTITGNTAPTGGAYSWAP